MHLILTGATGLVGSAVLRSMIKSTAVTKISILSRRAVPQAEGQEKCDVIIHKDFANYEPELLSRLADAKGVVWALGISQLKVGKEEYYRITHDYPLAFYKAFASIPPTDAASPTTFIYISGEGATHNPGTFTPIFGRVKGETEKDLLALSSTTTTSSSSSSTSTPPTRAQPVYAVRPAGVDPGRDAEIQPFVPPMGALASALLGGARVLARAQHTPTEPLGRVCVELATGDGALLGEGVGVEVSGGGRVVTNRGVRRLAGLD